jgi:hypothetical protein
MSVKIVVCAFILVWNLAQKPMIALMAAVPGAKTTTFEITSTLSGAKL